MFFAQERFLYNLLYPSFGLVVMDDEEVNSNQFGNKRKMPVGILFKDASLILKRDQLCSEILHIALPTALALMADPVASLIDTAFIGHLGPVELAAVGVSIAVFNQVSKITIFPLVSVTTSLVAEEDTVSRVNDVTAESHNLEEARPKNNEIILVPELDSGEIASTSSTRENPKIVNLKNEKRHIPSASSAMVIGALLGLFQAIFLIILAKPLLRFMGIKADSPMLTPAIRYLKLRSLGAPAILLSIAIQGIFRGFKDTKTPLYATVVGDVTNVILDAIFILAFHWGVSGAAIAHIISQYLITVILLWTLSREINLLPPKIVDLQFRRFLRSGSLLLARVIAATFCVTLAASLAARLGPIPMAAFQISLQIWLAASLLADGLAVAGQTILASAFAAKDHEKATATAVRVLQHGFVLGLVLAVVLGVGLQFGSILFTKDIHVIHLISISIPFVAATQPINCLAFVFDGVNFGASDFTFSAYSMVMVAVVSILCLVLLFHSHGFVGIWIALTIYMFLRMFAGFWRIGSGTGPWRFLRI